MSEELTAAVGRLAHVPGVRGALIVDAEAGVPVVEELREGVSGRAVAALVASLFRRADSGAATAGYGRLASLQLEAGGGHVVATGEAGAAELLAVAITEPSAQLGRVRLETRRALETLA